MIMIMGDGHRVGLVDGERVVLFFQTNKIFFKHDSLIYFQTLLFSN